MTDSYEDKYIPLQRMYRLCNDVDMLTLSKAIEQIHNIAGHRSVLTGAQLYSLRNGCYVCINFRYKHVNDKRLKRIHAILLGCCVEVDDVSVASLLQDPKFHATIPL